MTDVDLPQRALTATLTAAASEATGVERSSSVPLSSQRVVVGSCDSGLVEQDPGELCTSSSHHDRTCTCRCAVAVESSSPRLLTTPQRNGDADDDDVDRTLVCQSPPVSVSAANRQSWLLRLFESKLFDMSIAVQYLFNSKESGVQTYIGRSLSV